MFGDGAVTHASDQGTATSAPRSPLASHVRDAMRYEIIGEHGRGGLGRVSRARDRELGRDVAIKELLAHDPVNELRFVREALITARLEHPGIVPVHEAGCWPDGTPFYAMKLVSGRSLRDLIAERPAIEDRIGLLHHVIAVADAIAYAHRRNIIHRDLKPANIIVGEFGETVVIDWGLAKDLSVAEEFPRSSRSLPVQRNSELTSTGTVLGTPAYMAPEQERGEHVDQRADVFAIGAMLWELCAIGGLPPADPRLRHRVFRRTGIDDDLAIIISKALELDPARRYPDAGALAADLKAFKSGARIASRRYSLLAMLAHWTRRHRAMAISAAAVVAIAILGSAAYVRSIATERDRADASEDTAKRARAAAELALDQLTLNHAQLQLGTDPSAAIDTLAGYHGADRARADQTRAEAIGRGVAQRRATPHTSNILWTTGLADGSVVSLSTDGTIARTARDGRSSVMSRGVSRSSVSAYAPSRHLLAYACDPSDLCLLDVLGGTRIPLAAVLRGVQAASIAFSPDGTRLAVMSQSATLSVLDLADPAHPVVRLVRPIAGGAWTKFVDDRVVAAASKTKITLLGAGGDEASFPVADLMQWETSARDHALAFATANGQATVLAGSPFRVVAHDQLCRGLLFSVRFLAERHSVAFACRDGAVGIWDLQRGTVTPRLQLEASADVLATSLDGDYVIATSGTGTISVLDLATDLIASYKGHGTRLTSIAAPAQDYPFLISADARGALRVWPLPVRLARVAATATMPFNTAIFDHQSMAVTATTWSRELTTYSPEHGAQTAGPHDITNQLLVKSDTGRVFAAYGLRDSVEVWSSATMTRTNLIATGHGSVSQLRFVPGSDDFVTAGHDGRLVRWTPSGQPTVIAELKQAIDNVVLLGSGAAVVSTADGAVWRTDRGGQSVPVLGAGSRVSRILSSSDLRSVYVGYADGKLISIDTTTWSQQPVLQASGAIQALATTPDGQTMAVAAGDGTVRVSAQRPAAPSAGTTAKWLTLSAPARDIALASDGLVVAAGSDGAIWLYSPSTQHWLCLAIGAADLIRAVVSDDGKTAVALDRGGRLLWVDLEVARQRLLVAN
jgi:hypothetical protein